MVKSNQRRFQWNCKDKRERKRERRSEKKKEREREKRASKSTLYMDYKKENRENFEQSVLCTVAQPDARGPGDKESSFGRTVQTFHG